MFNYAHSPEIRHYIDVAHAERSRAMTGAIRSLFRATRTRVNSFSSAIRSSFISTTTICLLLTL